MQDHLVGPVSLDEGGKFPADRLARADGRNREGLRNAPEERRLEAQTDTRGSTQLASWRWEQGIDSVPRVAGLRKNGGTDAARAVIRAYGYSV